MCFWGSRWWIITFRGPQSPKTPILGTWIGTLSQICEKFKHCIFRSVYPIDLKFDRQLQPVTGTSWVVSYGGKTFPRWPTSAILKIDISPYLSEKSSDFHDVIKQEALLSQRGRAMLRVCITTLDCVATRWWKKNRTYVYSFWHESRTWKNRRFHVPQPTFLFPLETPLRLTRNMLHGWKDNSMLAKRLAACTIFNSFRVIRCLSQCVSPKIAIFTTFLFPLGTPMGQSR